MTTLPHTVSPVLTDGPPDEVPTPEMVANQDVLTRHFRVSYPRLLSHYVVGPIARRYFRVRLVGFGPDQFPERNNPDRPLILAGNHSGMAFPWDAMVFSSALCQRYDFDPTRIARPLTSPLLSKTRLMNPFLLPNFWRRAGGIDATRLNFQTVMRYTESHVLVYPEGIYGIGKGFNHRYELQRLSTSALWLSLQHRTAIVPFGCINGEYINPTSYSYEPLNRLMRRIGIPFLPLGPLTLLILVQPWIFYFGMPAQLTYVRGASIRPWEMTDKPYEQLTQADIYALRDRIQGQVQADLHQAAARLGQRPYDWRALWRTVRQYRHQAWAYLPFAWPFVFAEFDRRYQRLRAQHGEALEQMDAVAAYADLVREEEGPRPLPWWKATWRAVCRHPGMLWLYVPVLGLIPMAVKGYRWKSGEPAPGVGKPGKIW